LKHFNSLSQDVFSQDPGIKGMYSFSHINTDETIPPTNHASEQALRWSVVFRKVTNGFCSDWGAELFAPVRSLVNTAQRHGISAFDAISRALTSHQTDWLLG
jgi:transposase